MAYSRIQHGIFQALKLNPVYAGLARWSDRVWVAGNDEFGHLIVDRLNRQGQRFQAAGLFKPPDDARYPAANLDDLERWPVLERQGLKDLYPGLKKLRGEDRRYVPYQSGGSTGEPTQLYRHKTTSPQELLSMRNMLGIVGWRPGVLRVSLWGSPRDLGLMEAAGRGLKARLGRQMANVKAIGGYAPDEATYFEFIELVIRHPGCVVYGFAGLLEECARLMQQSRRSIPPGAISAMYSTAEMLHPHQREMIERAFGLAVRDMYGSRECPWMAAECEHGTRHVNPRYFVEALDRARQRVTPGETGELAVTDLFNEATPLIRYMVGDMGAVRWQSCACGRNGLALVNLEGRVNDQIRLASGQYLSSTFFPQIARQFAGIQKAQLARVRGDEFVARYTGEMSQAEEQRMAEIVRNLCPGVEISVKSVVEIPLTAQGKLMYYVDERPKQQ